MSFDPLAVRQKFPALAKTDNGRKRIYLDNPAGTQVPEQVVARISNYLIESNANQGGYFQTSRETDELLAESHRAAADFLNAPSEKEIIFGPNMTTLTYQMSRSLGTLLGRGDVLILTRMDHDANVAPWMQLAEDLGVEIRWLPFDRHSYRFDLQQFEELLDTRVRLAAFAYASNALGTINDVKAMSRMAKDVGALVFIDAVQYVPHGPTDVQDIDCDFLTCSVYKFFGGHQGILWGRESILQELKAYRVRPAGEKLPGKFETGTQSHEGQAGTLGALEYLEWVGETMGGKYLGEYQNFQGRRRTLHAAMAAIKDYEEKLSAHLIAGLQGIPGVTVHGITGPREMRSRVPTVAFTKTGKSPADIARALAAQNIFVWDGHYYAVEVIEHLGLRESGGMVRVGAAHYNTTGELDRLLEVVAGL